jgi:lysophospholipase L1-like esterase
MRKKALILYIFLLPLTFFLAGEAISRIYFKSHINFDIEMTHYANWIKLDSANPLIGHVHKPNSNAKLMGVNVAINSDGFRDEEHNLIKDTRTRIVFLGDSLTFGWGVDQDKNFKTILEKKMNLNQPTEIINLGTGNYNTQQEVNLFLEKGLKYTPDKVVLFYFINDAEPTQHKSKIWFLGLSDFITIYRSKIRLPNAQSTSFNDYYSSLYLEKNPGLKVTEESLLLLKNICDKYNIKLQIVILPELHNLQKYPFSKEQSIISDYLKSNNIQYLDITPQFNGITDPKSLWVALDDAHPNKRAHELIADFVYNFISERK